MVSKSKKTGKNKVFHEAREQELQFQFNKLWTDYLWLEASDQTILEIKILKPN